MVKIIYQYDTENSGLIVFYDKDFNEKGYISMPALIHTHLNVSKYGSVTLYNAKQFYNHTFDIDCDIIAVCLEHPAINYPFHPVVDFDADTIRIYCVYSEKKVLRKEDLIDFYGDEM